MLPTVPVHILAGFLGSGKTTLLTQALDYYKQLGKKPAVLMNEIGDVNLDGMLVDGDVPMTEMLSGCICCTIRGDLGLEIRNLVQESSPDVIFIEATGVANPLEIIDGVTDASLLAAIELKSVVTVIDAAHLLGQMQHGKGKTFKLMQEQIRCASVILLNKTDLVAPHDLKLLEKQIREWNEYAPIEGTVMCHTDIAMFDRLGNGGSLPRPDKGEEREDHACGPGCSHEHHHHDDSAAEHRHDPSSEHDAHTKAHAHHTHDHVMAYTHYFAGPIDSLKFEELLSRLPQEVYRAKGILRFTDTASRFMFQFAYREADFMKITPQGDVPDVAVFIGEHFSKEEIRSQLLALEGRE
ncbi:CobW family GTP-binding protein [Paenibacillus hamazuiensis]|uniref:CobW family GTP-binding protein n=1 Tax=Paenibacillus hamazuiensis TaxID=2936508 RepID=UPI00200CEE0B|nr:GTP-binding protein [Paenibacillus hamazuiensis]